METELKNTEESIRSLPRRVRFYHSIIDADSLKSGADYTSLKKVVVIMITPFDPFGFDYTVYTIGNACKEVPELLYDDGAKTIFLYTQGKKGDVPQSLKELLNYMEDTSWENAKNDALKKIQSLVEVVKRDKGVSLEYMKIFEKEQMLREEGREEERKNTERERARAEQERKNTERERARAEQERKNMERERVRAEQERKRADMAEEENRKLREEIERLKRA